MPGKLTDAELLALVALLQASSVTAAANNQIAAARGEPGGYFPDGVVEAAIHTELQARGILP